MALNTIVSAARKQQVQAKTVSVSVENPVQMPIQKKEIIEADESAYYAKKDGRSTSVNAIVNEIQSKKRVKGSSEAKTWESCKSIKHCDTGKHACTKFMRFCVMEKCPPKCID